jgi:hypothetical protein
MLRFTHCAPSTVINSCICCATLPNSVTERLTQDPQCAPPPIPNSPAMRPADEHSSGYRMVVRLVQCSSPSGSCQPAGRSSWLYFLQATDRPYTAKGEELSVQHACMDQIRSLCCGYQRWHSSPETGPLSCRLCWPSPHLNNTGLQTAKMQIKHGS